MKIAMAQIDMRLGDIDAVCARIKSQADLAQAQGASVLCTPVPLFSGALPGSLVYSPDYENELLHALQELAESFAETDFVLLVPAAVVNDDEPLMELFMLRHGRVVPARSAIAVVRDRRGADLWAPPVFDVAGVRIAVTFDAARDVPEMYAGIDLCIYFQAHGFMMNDSTTCGAPGLPEGSLCRLTREKSIWFAQMAPVGAYDEVVYTGGSYVLDDNGAVVAAAPCFEEALLVQEVCRGTSLPAVEDYKLPRFNRDEYLWRALLSALRAAARARSTNKAVVLLEGNLQSSLTAALCVDAFGPRNVFGVALRPRPNASDAALDAYDYACETANKLGIQLRQTAGPEVGGQLPSGFDEYSVLLDRWVAGYAADVADFEEALLVSSLTKTDYAVAALHYRGMFCGDIAPFGDVYLTTLEFLARSRNHAGACVPAALVGYDHVKACMEQKMEWTAAGFRVNPGLLTAAMQVLGKLEPSAVDSAIEAHVDRNLAFEDIPMTPKRFDAVALLLMVVRNGEAARRTLPMAPYVSERPFAERRWPMGIAWSAVGLQGKERLSVEGLAHAEVTRQLGASSEQSERVRGEFMEMLGNMLGLSSEQIEELQSNEGQERIRENLEKFQSQVEDAINEMLRNRGNDDGPRMQGQPYFSSN